jgi:hypothetical protein
MKKRLYAILVMGIISLMIFSCCINEEEEKSVNGIKIAGSTFTTKELFEICEERTLEGNSGIALDDMIRKSGIDNPEGYTYTLIASDNYQKTVKWEDMQKGILTNESLAVFPHLPKMYWIRDVVEVRRNE